MDKFYLICATCGENHNLNFEDVEKSLNKYEKELKLIYDALQIDYSLGVEVRSLIRIYDDNFSNIVRIMFMSTKEAKRVYAYAHKFAPIIYYKEDLI